VNFRRRRKPLISDDELDIVLASLHEKQLAAITRRLDLDAGFRAAVPEEQWSAESVLEEPQGVGPDDVSKDMVDVDSAAVSAVRELLTELDVSLDRIADSDDAARSHTARSTGFVSVAGGHLTALIRGLAQRALTRPEALGALGLVEHNLKEAALLLRSEHAHTDASEVRTAIEEHSDALAAALARLPELRRRVSRLFDDTPHVADRVGSPR